MSITVPNVSYSYATGPIGFESVGASAVIGADSSLRDIYEAYNNVFAKYENMRTVLLGQLNALLGLQSGVAKTYDGELDLSAIFDENELSQCKCKEGAKAYKYYLREVITQLNSLRSWNERAKGILEQFRELLQNQSVEDDTKAHYLINELEISDKHAQESLKAFTQYVVHKNFTVMKGVAYDDGTGAKWNVTQEAYSTFETEYDGVLRENSGVFSYQSKLADSYDSLEALRKINTEKINVTRAIEISYLKDGKLADKYDGLAQQKVEVTDNPTSTIVDKIELFDELPLLDKLKYIILYYETAGDHYNFPKDTSVGFPCIRPKGDLVLDNDEIGELEMFYIGYLVNRDGPANALAAFLEVKSVAVREQALLNSYRVKALQYYLNLLNKGLELMNQSQSGSGRNPIPRATYNILRYVGGNGARSLFFIKDKNGNFLNDSLKEPYIIIWHGYDNGAHPWYMLVRTTQEGIDRAAWYMGLDYRNGSYEFDNIQNNGSDAVPEDSIAWLDGCYSVYDSRCFGSCSYGDRDNCPIVGFWEEGVKHYLPRLLDVTRVNADDATGFENGGMWWDDTEPSENEQDPDGAWQNVVNRWTTVYNTAIENYKTQLEYEQKSVASLRKKIDTIDSMASSFRSKAYTIYNKIVNKIN